MSFFKFRNFGLALMLITLTTSAFAQTPSSEKNNLLSMRSYFVNMQRRLGLHKACLQKDSCSAQVDVKQSLNDEWPSIQTNADKFYTSLLTEPNQPTKDIHITAELLETMSFYDQTVHREVLAAFVSYFRSDFSLIIYKTQTSNSSEELIRAIETNLEDIQHILSNIGHLLAAS